MTNKHNNIFVMDLDIDKSIRTYCCYCDGFGYVVMNKHHYDDRDISTILGSKCIYCNGTGLL
jgi:hypothetical protein